MTLVELIKSQKYNEEKYNFVISFKDCHIINTCNKITFKELFMIIGLKLEYKEIEYKVTKSNVVMIVIKDS